MSVDKEIDRFLEELEIGLTDDKGDLNVRGIQYPGSYGGMAFVKDDVQLTMELIPVDDSMNRVLVQPDSSGQLMVEGAAPSWQKQAPYESINLVRGVESRVPDMVMAGQPAYSVPMVAQSPQQMTAPLNASEEVLERISQMQDGSPVGIDFARVPDFVVNSQPAIPESLGGQIGGLKYTPQGELVIDITKGLPQDPRVPDMIIAGQPAYQAPQAPQQSILRDRAGNPITAGGKPIMIPRQNNPAVGGGKGAGGK